VKISNQKIIEILSLIIGTEACLVMAGWIFGADFLTRIIPDGINMKFPTALAFLFSAIALYLIFRIIKDDYELSTLILPGIALMLFLIMGVILLASFTNTQTGLLADLTGTQTGIENLFVKEQNPIYAEGSGVPAVITIVNFIIFGFACLYSLFSSPKRQKMFKIIGWFIIISSLIPIMGYILSLPALYFEIYGWTPIAFNTALSFFLLGLGLIIIGTIKTNHET
jgi:hypothetical protein